MSIQSYLEAKRLMENNEGSMHWFGKQEESLINKAEKILNLKFPQDYRMFLSDYGAGSFGSSEIYGVFQEDFENSGVPDAVWYTLVIRKDVKMPNYLLAIYGVGDGELFVLNYDKLNENGEPKVTAYSPGYAEDEQTFEVIANDFGDFLLGRVKRTLDRALKQGYPVVM